MNKQNNIEYCDMHVHSQNSHDCNRSVAETAEAAIKNGIAAFAITDHCDIEYPERLAWSLKEAEEEAERFKGKVKILKGIEIGEAIWDKPCAKEILGKNDFDIIVGSVHAVRYKDYTAPYSTIDFSKMTSAEINEYMSKYFDEVLETLETISCDVMAHLTCPLRYINGRYNMQADIRQHEDKIFKILNYIKDNSIAMEINTSSVNNERVGFMPDEWIVKAFKDMGGYLVTIGSDSHNANPGKDFDKAIALLKKYKYKDYYYYQKRIPIPVHLAY